MRKLGFTLFSCIALVAFMGLSAPAFAVIDPDCDGDPYPNDFAVFGFAVSTPDSQLQHAVSGVTGSGAACGSDINGQQGTDPGRNSLNFQADIVVPPQVRIASAPNPGTGLNDGDYVGTAVIDLSTYVSFFGGALHVEDEVAVMRADTPTGVVDQCPLDAVACYRWDMGGLMPLHGWWYVTQRPDGRYVLTIDRFFQDVTGEDAGLTQIDLFSLCGYAGTGGTTCGDSSRPYLQRNGHASYPNCENGNGIYSVTATNRGGATTAPATACVEWTAPPTPPTPTCLEPLPARPWTVLGTSTAKPETACARSRGADPSG